MLGIICYMLFCCEFRVDVTPDTTDSHIGVHRRIDYIVSQFFFDFNIGDTRARLEFNQIYLLIFSIRLESPQLKRLFQNYAIFHSSIILCTIFGLMSESNKRDLGQQQRINHLQLIVHDPFLSQFKHHLILHRVYIPHLQFNQFANNLYRYFRANLPSNAIYIVQIVETYDHFLYDVAVGFRRDNDAIHMYEKNRKIMVSGKEVLIELAEAFKIYVDGREGNSVYKKGQRKRKSYSSSSSSSYGYKRRRKDSGRRSRSRSYSDSVSRSRSRSRRSRSRSISQSKSGSISRSDSPRGRQPPFKATVFLPLIPYEWGKELLQFKLCESLKCPRYQLSIQDKRGQLSSSIVNIRSQGLYSQFLSGVRIGDINLLALKAEDVQANGLKGELRKYLFKAQRLDFNCSDSAFEELALFLLNFKEFHLKVVLISTFENCFLVTTQTRISSILKFLKLSGWKFDTAHFLPRLQPSLQDRWFQYVSSKNKGY